MWRTVSSIVIGLVASGVVATCSTSRSRLGLPGLCRGRAGDGVHPGHEDRTTVARRARLPGGRRRGAGAIAPASRAAPWVVGLVLLALFVPVHVQLWDRFPVWYHLTFLVSLAPLVVIGAAALRPQSRDDLRDLARS